MAQQGNLVLVTRDWATPLDSVINDSSHRLFFSARRPPMFVRSRVLELLPLFVVAAIIGCGNPQGLDSVAVSPSSQALVVGQTAQFTATGTYGNANHQSTQII